MLLHLSYVHGSSLRVATRQLLPYEHACVWQLLLLPLLSSVPAPAPYPLACCVCFCFLFLKESKEISSSPSRSELEKLLRSSCLFFGELHAALTPAPPPLLLLLLLLLLVLLLLVSERARTL